MSKLQVNLALEVVSASRSVHCEFDKFDKEVIPPIADFVLNQLRVPTPTTIRPTAFSNSNRAIKPD
jgi:hypothetical protein